MSTLRERAVRGGTILAARQALSLAVGLGGTIALTRLLGPTEYGRFAAALALEIYLASVAQLGIHAWLVRSETTDAAARATARALLLISGVAIAGIGVGLLPLVERWLGGAGVRPLALWLIAGIPVQALTLVPLAELERRLDYQTVAFTETVAQITQYLVSIGLVLAGLGVAALLVGWWVQQLLLLAVLQMRSEDRVAFGVDGALAARGLRYGLGYASSIWTWQLRDLVNPLIIGRFLGVDGVALVALAVRMVDAASFVKAATWRLALPALARLQTQPAKLAIAVREGMRVQIFTLAPVLMGLVLVVPAVVPWVFGQQWLGMRPLLPLVAAGTFANAMFNLHCAALYARGDNFSVTRFHLIFVVAFAAAAYRLAPLVSVSAYGLAEIVALPAYIAVFLSFKRATRVDRGSLSDVDRAAIPQRLEIAVGLAVVIALAGSAWNSWFLVLGVGPLAFAPVRDALRASVGSVRATLQAKASA